MVCDFCGDVLAVLAMGTDPWYGKAGLPDTAKLLNQDILMGEPFILGNYGLVIWNYVFFDFVLIYVHVYMFT